ncbi:MAG: peptidoglycan editing factor PgeF [Rhodospirillales bacterium]|nr:peptidoglycan editing factor PgeF [Rhodospirillales bacterium]MCW8861750.1 peptidoglycan editing factor PgeF [Rhodospirillales bacterium]MCW8951395.1 peptidoglycan editing factor PgeF [Rhodospirillales bacterium]MCW8969804.1 peptidoglycan editing factor PgeF [Rhodospirillales bacterium]MCW9002497.1 peptidoglycan editing factor PgeF [Rhodospirillales bacterium]
MTTVLPDPPTLTLAALSGGEGVRHAFFGRQGGVSKGIYSALNCGPGSNDVAGHVHENRNRAMMALGLDGRALITVHQVHSADAVTVTAPWGEGGAPKADALVTRKRGVALGILTADCTPILFADAAGGVVGAAHAGWKGALGGIAEATVAAMEELGAKRGRIIAGIGPCIAQASYEVGPEFHRAFISASEGNNAFFTPSSRGEHHLFDLPGYVRSRLDALGLAAVESAGCDTCADEDRYFSYRRATHRREADYGRQLSAIALTP